MAVLGWITVAYSLVRKVEDILRIQEDHNKTIAKLSERLTAAEQRLTELEHGREVLVTDVKSAARDASHQATNSVPLDIGTKIGRLEGRCRPRIPLSCRAY